MLFSSLCYFSGDTLVLLDWYTEQLLASPLVYSNAGLILETKEGRLGRVKLLTSIRPLIQWSPILLAPETGPVEDNPYIDRVGVWWGGVGPGMIQAYHIHHTLHFHYYHIAVYNETENNRVHTP